MLRQLSGWRLPVHFEFAVDTCSITRQDNGVPFFRAIAARSALDSSRSLHKACASSCRIARSSKSSMGIRHIFLSCTPRIDVLTTNASSRNVCRFGKRLAERIARRGIGRRNNPEAYGQGWDAYGGRFGASLARSASSNFFGDFVFASIFSQDPRFFPESKPTFWGSVKYSGRTDCHHAKRPGKRCVQHFGPVGAAGRGGAG